MYKKSVIIPLGLEILDQDKTLTAMQVRQMLKDTFGRRSGETIHNAIRFLGGRKNTAEIIREHVKHTADGKACFCPECYRLAISTMNRR